MLGFFLRSSLCLLIVWFGGGCSGDEQPPVPESAPKVVKQIVRPQPPPVALEEGPVDVPDPEAAPAPETALEIQSAPDPEAALETKAAPAPENSLVAEEGPPTETLPPSQAPVTAHADSLMPPEITSSTQEIPEERDPNIYRVLEGETLRSIAAREGVYADPLKWPLLCRHSMEALHSLDLEEDFHRKTLPAGLRLRIRETGDSSEGPGVQPERLWVVNVFSSKIEDELTLPAVRLLAKGYPVYITRARIKGEEWLRLRVGFYEKMAGAARDKATIQGLLDYDDLWVAKVSESEFEEFAGY